MATKHRRTVLDQMTATVSKVKPLARIPMPRKGWIRAIREALGMGGSQLAKRLGVSAPRVTRIEHDELTGALTMATLRRVAEAMQCQFVYALVPRTTLEEIVRAQARRGAEERMKRVSHSMMLEAQALNKREEQRAIDRLVEQLVRELPADLWKDRE